MPAQFRILALGRHLRLKISPIFIGLSNRAARSRPFNRLAGLPINFTFRCTPLTIPAMNVLGALKQKLLRWFLRGRALEWWLQQKMRRLETRYASALVNASRGKPAPDAPAPLKSGAPLRRLLFISDIMWESRELVPELAKI